jgi:hypothetical protein
MKNEMIKFVSENFEVIKNNFYKSEFNILEEMFEDDINDKEEFDYLSEFLINQMKLKNNLKKIIEISFKGLPPLKRQNVTYM